MSLTYKEMKEQYKALRKTFDYMETRKDEIIRFYREKSPKSLTYIGCGSGFCLCQSGEMTARVRLGIPSAGLAAGDLMLNHKAYRKLLEGTMIVAPSRSGSTSEVIKAIEKVRTDSDIPVLAIVCVENSPLTKVAELTVELPWAFDESVCQTRTVVNLYTANLLIAAYLSGDGETVEMIDKVIEAGDSYMSKYEESIKAVAQGSWSNVVILADGEMQGIAAEGAIAMTEIAQIPGSFYHLLDVRHGPMVLVNKNTLVVACLSGNDFEYQKALIKDIAARGAEIIVYSDMPVEEIKEASLQITSGIKLDNAVSGIPFIFIPQTLAYYRAVKEGVNPDSPNGLAAWIKL